MHIRTRKDCNQISKLTAITGTDYLSNISDLPEAEIYLTDVRSIYHRLWSKGICSILTNSIESYLDDNKAYIDKFICLTEHSDMADYLAKKFFKEGFI